MIACGGEGVGWGRGEGQCGQEDEEGLKEEKRETRSSWLNCALRDDEAVYWVSIGHY